MSDASDFIDPPRALPDRLDTWKQIAAYLRREVRTVQRWEEREGLPVHRHLHDHFSTVYAYRHELDAWLRSRAPQVPGLHVVPRNSPAWVWFAAGVVALAALLAVVRYVPVGTESAKEMVLRRIWTGTDIDQQGAIAPDGRWLCHADPETQDLALLDLETGVQQRRFNNAPRSSAGSVHSCAFAPDGGEIAFGWDVGAGSELRIVRKDGGGLRTVLRHPDLARIRVFAWARNRSFILAQALWRDGSNHLIAVPAGEGAFRTIHNLGPTAAWKAALSADDRWIAFDLPSEPNSAERDIYIVSALPMSGGQPPIPVVRHQGPDLLLGWDSRNRILYRCERTGTQDAWLLPVSSRGKPGEPSLLRRSIGVLWPLNFSGAGNYYFGVPMSETDVHEAAFDSGSSVVTNAPRAVSNDNLGINRSPDWSPDGRRLAWIPSHSAFTNWARPRISIREGSRTYSVDVRLFSIESIRWMPDGRAVLAAGIDLRNRPGIFLIPVDGAPVRAVRLAAPGAHFHEPLGALGGDVYFKLREGAREPSPLYWRDGTTGRERIILPAVYRIALSPDLRRMAYSSFDEKSQYIAIMPTAGGPGQEILREPRNGRIVSLCWTRDGRSLLFARRGKLWRIPVSGGAAPVFAGLEIDSLSEIRMSPSGRSLAFSAGSGTRSEIWRLENLPESPAASAH